MSSTIPPVLGWRRQERVEVYGFRADMAVGVMSSRKAGAEGPERWC